jgi:hypothetical protein
LVESAAEKDAILKAKIKTVGNYVHDSVPLSNNEVRRDLRDDFEIAPREERCVD